MAIIERQMGEFKIVMETTPAGRTQVALGRRDRVIDIPSLVCGNLYEPVPIPLGRGESIRVIKDDQVVIKG